MKTTERNNYPIKNWYKAYLVVFIWILFSSLICLFVYWKYKRKNHFIFLILLFYPVLSYAQYMDKTQCKISFSSHANQAGKLEYTQDGIIHRFTPESNAWKITIKNNTNKNARINWEKGSFIINGKASGISLYPFTSDDPPTDVIKEKSEITRTVTASNLIKGKKVNKIYSKRNLKRNGRTSVNIALPIGIGNKPQFFHIFNFIVTAN